MSIQQGRDAAERPGEGIDDRVRGMVQRMRSLQEGELAVFDALAIGPAAVPSLRELLFERDRTGIFEPRKHAVQALTALNALGVLKEFVAKWQPAPDPIERFGDEAVLSAAARVLATVGDEETFTLLSTIARDHPVSGVVEALGCYTRVESIPILIAALADDCAGAAAEQGFRAISREAVPALVQAVSRRTTGPSGRETPSSILLRRRALSLLLEFGATREIWDKIHKSANDPDDEIAALACRIGIAAGDHAQVEECVARLVEILRRVAWPVRQEVENCLIDNFGLAREPVVRALREASEIRSVDIERARFIRSLRKVISKASAGRGALH